MTFENAAFAINGALIPAALVRRAEYADTSGAEGVVLPGDLKVTQLSTPGVGVQIDDGVALILNRYLDNPNETYVASNPGTHTITQSEMPASNPSARSYLVAIVIGDPDFDQVGHPWMSSDDPPAGTETTFRYVRPTIVAVAAGTTSAASLGYPALALARIDVPANTTTITNSMITDLRALARPRSKRIPLKATGPGTPEPLTGTGLHAWPAPAAWQVDVPEWATSAHVMGSLEGTGVTKAGAGVLAFEFAEGGAFGNLNVAGETVGSRGFVVGGLLPLIPEAYRGTKRTVRMIAATNNVASNGFLTATATTTAFFVLEFVETVV